MRRHGPLTLFVVGVALLLLCWVFVNPRGAAPDEPANLRKALGTTGGQLTGRSARDVSAPAEAVQRAYYLRTTREFDVPARVAPQEGVCYAFQPRTSAACEVAAARAGATRAGSGDTAVATPQGTYPPALYLPLGLGRWFADSETGATYAGRIGGAIVALALLAWAAALVGRARPMLTAAYAASVTPMVLYLSAAVSTSGMEIAAGICTWVAGCRLTRDDEPGSAVPALCVSSAVLAVGRSLGPFLVAANLVGIALLARRDRLRAVVTGLRRRSSLGWVALLLAAVVAGAVWAAAVMPRPGFSIGDTIDRLPGAWRQLPAESAQTVGVFGWLDAHLPLVGYGIWFAVLLALIAVAVRRGGVAAAWRLGLLVVGALALTLFVAAGVLGAIHFSMQARYVMPVTLGVVLAAGELADRAREPRGLGLATAIVGACAVVHVVAVWANLRRYAVGTGGPRWFLGHEQWTPPGGSLGWLLLAVTGAVLAGAALVVRIRPPAAGVGQALGS